MPQIEIRPVLSTDFDELIKINLSNRSEYVWQMDRVFGEGQITIGFREVRLPRAIQVESPRSAETLHKAAEQSSGTLVGVFKGTPIAFINLDDGLVPNGVWVKDLAVLEQYRRQGIGSALLLAAQEWAVQRRLRKVILETQSKNYPGIRLALKLGFELSGYNDQYYSNQDIALFFSRLLR